MAVCNDDNGKVRGAASILSLAATPSFALMALLTASYGGGGMSMCGMGSGPGLASLDGMVPMYLLMSLFHASPWVRLIQKFRHG